jgi:hypothetical protein
MFIYIGDEAEGICVHGMAWHGVQDRHRRKEVRDRRQ